MEAEERAFLEEHRVGRLATCSADLRPHCVPVCYLFTGTHLVVPLDEKPKSVELRRLRRVRNIEENPRVTFLVDRYSEDWSRLAFLMIEGEARVDTLSDEERCDLRERYEQYVTHDLQLCLRIAPERHSFWSAS